jgi:hypothetical protein
MRAIAAVFVMLLFCCPLLLSRASPQNFAYASEASSLSQQQGGKIFVWAFGYVGNTFYPQSQLGITSAQMISQAANMSEALNSTTSLVFVSAVDQLAGRQISWNVKSDVAAIRNYVANLSNYGQVYGRLDLQQFNSTGFGGNASKISIYQEVKDYYTVLSLKGVWLDHASVLYHDSPTAFNSMMQNLTKTFPSLIFILNQTAHEKFSSGIIKPSAGTTWANDTYVSPSVLVGSYSKLPQLSQFQTWNKYYPGRVLLHFDSYAQTETEPMGLFADQQSSTEISTIKQLAVEGNGTYGFTLLYPIVGGWTYKESPYGGMLYNSFNFGKLSRNTYSSFLPIMAEYP